jgi:hypothetical protein
VDAEQVAAALLRVVMLSGPKVEVLDNVTLRSGLT